MTSIIYGITRLIGALDTAANAVARFFNKHYLSLSSKTLTALIVETQKALSRKDRALDFNDGYASYQIDKIIDEHGSQVERINARHIKAVNKIQARGGKIGKR